MKVSVVDPFGAANDPEMPTLAAALDGREAHRALKRRLPRLAGPNGLIRLRGARVTRYKPARRCVIEYDVEIERRGAAPEAVTLVGKVRARRFGLAGYRRLDAIWRAGFQSDSRDGVSVPEPVGAVSELSMWLQRKVPGRVAAELLAEPDAVTLARWIVDAVHKLHRAPVPTDKRHTMADELRMLHERLPGVANGEGRRRVRIDRLLRACVRVAAASPPGPTTPIHRDFYADQVLVDEDRLYLIDFDELCAGDPALDVGNFIGAVTEQSLRTLGDPEALAEVERAVEARFAELSGEAALAPVEAYALLTLVRQVWVASRIPDRRQLVESLLDLCEERLAVQSSAWALG